MAKSRNFWYHILAVITVAIWGTTFVSTKILIGNGLNPTEIFLYRFVLAYAGILFVAGKRMFANNLWDELTLLLAGITGGSLYFITENTALQLTTASNVAMIIAITPLLTTLLSSLFFKSERLHRPMRVIAGSLIALVGVAAVVYNGNFVLNGVPVFLRGRCFNQTLLNPSRHGYVYALAMNVNGYGHKFFETFRNLNHNYLRLNSYALGRNMYEHLDELGIIASDELYYKSIRLEHPRRIDEIAKHSYRNVCDAKGNLLPEFQTYLRDRLFLTWSNPSLCLHSFGNEIRDFGYVSNMMNNIYDFFRKWEKQNLPQTPSSGRVYQEATNLDRIRGEKFDYIDTHAYAPFHPDRGRSLRQRPFSDRQRRVCL